MWFMEKLTALTNNTVLTLAAPEQWMLLGSPLLEELKKCNQTAVECLWAFRNELDSFLICQY